MPLDITSEMARFQNYLQTTDMTGSYLESCLADYFLIVIHAEYELEIKNMVYERIDKSNDATVVNYAKNHVDVRSLKTSALKGNILNKFDKKCGDVFGEKIRTMTLEVAKYDSIIINRNSVAHGMKSNMTFGEIMQANLFAKKILAAFSDSLSCR